MIGRPEHELLLACARVCSESERRDLIHSCLGRKIDWEYLLETAGRHMVTSLLYWHVNAICRDAVPQAILQRLHSHFLKSAKSNLFFTAELLRIIDLFDKNGIKAIPFKGPVLGITLYEDPALREFVDLDVLVQKGNVFRALRLLPALGYRRIPEYSPAVEAGILKWGYNYHLGKENGQSFIELHWNVMPVYFGLPLSTDRWWERAESVTVQARAVCNLSAEDLLMALSAHGCRHMWGSLAWIGDLARLFNRHPEVNWDSVFKEYSHPDLQRMIFLGAIVAHDLLGAALPSEIIQRARQDSVAAELARKVQEGLFHQGGNAERLRLKLLQLRLKSHWTGRIRFCYRALLTLGYRNRL